MVGSGRGTRECSSAGSLGHGRLGVDARVDGGGNGDGVNETDRFLGSICGGKIACPERSQGRGRGGLSLPFPIHRCSGRVG